MITFWKDAGPNIVPTFTVFAEKYGHSCLEFSKVSED